jgi:hypothetical protein
MDSDASAYVDAHDLTDLAETINVPAEFLESLDAWDEDDFRGVASCAPSWVDPMDIDGDGIYFYSEEVAEEARLEEESERTYRADVDAAYRAATGF